MEHCWWVGEREPGGKGEIREGVETDAFRARAERLPRARLGQGSERIAGPEPLRAACSPPGGLAPEEGGLLLTGGGQRGERLQNKAWGHVTLPWNVVTSGGVVVSKIGEEGRKKKPEKSFFAGVPNGAWDGKGGKGPKAPNSRL